jgi:hypothetical protein
MRLTAILIELIGIITVATGIGLEIAYSGAAYLVVITSGSCLVATGGVIWGKFLRGR